MALKRELGYLGVFAVGTGAMISSGLFVLPAIAFGKVGPGVFLCYLLAAVLLLPALLSKAELVTAMPKAGGDYYFIDRSLGPALGTVGGIAAWASLAFKSAFALLGIGLLMPLVGRWGFSPWHVKGVACAACVLVTALNLAGVKVTGRIQIWLVAALLLVLVGYVAAGVGSVNPARYEPLFPHGWNSLLAGAAVVFISFGGITKVATLGEEVRRPKRDILVGMFASYVIVGLLYVAAVFVTVGLLPASEDAWTFAPLSQAAGTLWGQAGATVLAFAALCAFLTTGNAGILAASRTVMAMSQDGLLPPWLRLVGKKRGTPHYAILFTSAFMLSVILLLKLEVFVKAASALKILLFMFVMLSLIMMRESRIPTYRPSWRCPFYPWLQIAGVLCYGFLLVELGSLVLAIAGAILGGALVWYALYAKVRVMRESALVRLAARLAAADFQDHDIEAELARVVHERDQVVEDRFDRLVQQCPALDLPGRISRDELFRKIADLLAAQTPHAPEKLCAMLNRREALSSTLVRPGLAIPHLVLEELDTFQIILIRSRDGIQYEKGQPPVRIVFALAAPTRERNFYLKALVAIAEIAQNPEFDRRWLKAKSAEALREIILVAERRREHAPEGQAATGGEPGAC